MIREHSIFNSVIRLAANAGAPDPFVKTKLRMAKPALSAGLHSTESGGCGDE